MSPAEVDRVRVRSASRAVARRARPAISTEVRAARAANGRPAKAGGKSGACRRFAHRVKGRILIVDDDRDWRDFLRMSLEGLGFEGVEASSGEEALELMGREQFPIVLLDIRMPGLSGTEVIDRMRPPLPRIVLLTSTRAEDLGDALSERPCYYLPKDAGAEALSLIINSLDSHDPQ